jgi:hypothetical protein
VLAWLLQILGIGAKKMSDTVDTPQSSKNINTCRPEIVKAFDIVCGEWEARHPGMPLKVDWCYRTPVDQFEFYKQGREYNPDTKQWMKTGTTVTDDDGINTKSHHNVYPSQAADVLITQNGKILWGGTEENEALYIELGKIWEAQGLISGATWKFNWKDPDHVQLAYTIV